MVRLRPNWSRSLELFLASALAPAPAAAPWRAGLAGSTAGTREHADDLVADLLRVGVEVEQDAGGDALVLPHEPEQDVLGADVVVAEGEGLAKRELQHLLGARGERDLARRHLFALADDARDVGADVLDGDVQLVEDAGSEPLLLTEEAEEDVLGADVVVLEGAGFVLREHDDLPRAFGEPLEHASALLSMDGDYRGAGPRVGQRSVASGQSRWRVRRSNAMPHRPLLGEAIQAASVPRTLAPSGLARTGASTPAWASQSAPARPALSRGVVAPRQAGDGGGGAAAVRLSRRWGAPCR